MLRPSAGHRITNLAQSLLLIAAMAGVAWVTLRALVGPELAAAIAVGGGLGLLFAPRVPKRMLLGAYGARPLGRREFPLGHALLAELARRAGLPRAPALYYVPSRMPNAFALGAPEDSAICVTDGMLRLLNRHEFAGVLAHEISHVAHRDLRIMALADLLARIVSLAAWAGQIMLLINIPLLVVGATVIPWHLPLLLILSPAFVALLQLALSRTREYEADRGAVALTGDAEGLVSALRKLERRVGSLWEEIVLPGRRIPEPSLLRTHPPTEKRVARMRALAPPTPRPALPEGDVTWRRAVAPPPRFGRFGVWR